MAKVYLDIGTNQFQGYDILRESFGIDDSWIKIFIEPNPEFVRTEGLMARINSIPNAKFYNAALCGVRCKMALMVNKGMQMDQGATIYEKHAINSEDNYDHPIVETITLGEVLKDHGEDELFVKFDCEGCEYECLPILLAGWGKNVRKLVCEFHHLGNPKQEEFLIQKVQIMKQIATFPNIEFMEWH